MGVASIGAPEESPVISHLWTILINTMSGSSSPNRYFGCRYCMIHDPPCFLCLCATQEKTIEKYLSNFFLGHLLFRSPILIYHVSIVCSQDVSLVFPKVFLNRVVNRNHPGSWVFFQGMDLFPMVSLWFVLYFFHIFSTFSPGFPHMFFLFPRLVVGCSQVFPCFFPVFLRVFPKFFRVFPTCFLSSSRFSPGVSRFFAACFQVSRSLSPDPVPRTPLHV